MSGRWLKGENGVLLNSGRRLLFPDRQSIFRTQMDGFYETDCLSSGGGAASPYSFTLVSGGSILAPNNAQIVAGRPGIYRCRNGTTANGGVLVNLSFLGLLYQGGESTLCIGAHAPFATGITTRIGFHNGTTSALPTNGNFFDIDGGTGIVTPRNIANSVATAAGSTFTLTALTWYQFRVDIAADRASARYRILASPDTGTPLYDQTVVGNMPALTAANAVASAFITNHTAIVAADLFHLDYINADLGRLIR